MMPADVSITSAPARPGLKERLPDLPLSVVLSMVWMALMNIGTTIVATRSQTTTFWKRLLSSLNSPW